MSAGVSPVPDGHEYIVVQGLGGPWLAEVTNEYPEPSPIGLIDDLLRAAAALPLLREQIAAEVLGPVRALLPTRRDAGPLRCGDNHGLSFESAELLRAALSAPVQVAEWACTTPGCDGDGRYSAPGRGHRDDCRWPVQAAEEVGGDA